MHEARQDREHTAAPAAGPGTPQASDVDEQSHDRVEQPDAALPDAMANERVLLAAARTDLRLVDGDVLATLCVGVDRQAEVPYDDPHRAAGRLGSYAGDDWPLSFLARPLPGVALASYLCGPPSHKCSSTLD